MRPERFRAVAQAQTQGNRTEAIIKADHIAAP